MVGDPSGLWHIDESSGWISNNAALDYNDTASYELTVQGKDMGGNSLSTTTVAYIVVTKGIDIPPVFAPAPNELLIPGTLPQCLEIVTTV